MAMTVQSGEAVERALETSLLRVRKQMEQHVAGLRELDDQVKELIQRRGDAIVELARQYLPDVTHETIQSTFVEIRDDLLAILARKQRRQRELHDQASDIEQQIDRQEGELHELTAALEEKVAERERLEELLAERLRGSTEFKELSKQALAAEQELENNEQRVAEIRDEADRKLPSYENSKLFKYLFDRDFGTGAYDKKGLTRRIDGWVAKLIDFPAARRSYQFLRVTPELMAQEVERRRNAFNGLMEQVEEIEENVADEIGLTDVMRQGQELGAKRDDAVGALAQKQDELLKTQESIVALDRPDSEFHAQAVARMQNFLANMGPQRLRSEAQATVDRSDDAIVSEIGWLNDQLKDLDRRSDALGQERLAWDQRLSGLQQTLQQFRRMEYDSRRSYFPSDFNVSRLIEAYVDGRSSQPQLWSEIETQQRFAPRNRPFGGSQSRSPFGGEFPTDLLASGASQILFHVLSEVAGHALRNGVHRTLQRRSSTRRRLPDVRRHSSRRKQSRPTAPKPRRRGFTNGRGF